MHQDLFAIRDLWQVDQERDALRAEAGALAEAVEAARLRLQRARGDVVTAEAALEVLKTEERRLNRRLDDYIGRRDTTRKLIDEGRAPDFFAAQRQFEQCRDIASDTEDALLEVMESREQAEATLAAARASVVAGQDALSRASQHQAERRPQVVARYRELGPVRDQRWAELPARHHRRYQDQRDRERPALTWIANGHCEFCHREIAHHITNEVLVGRTPHVCRGCGCFLYDVRPAEEVADEAPDE